MKKTLSLFILISFYFINPNLFAKSADSIQQKKYHQALSKYQQKDFLEAIKFFQTDLKKYPERASSYYYIALSGIGLREKKIEPCEQGSLSFIWNNVAKSVQLEPELKKKIKNNPKFKELHKQLEYLTLIEGLDPKVPEDLKKILLKAHWEFVRAGNYPQGDLILKEKEKLTINEYSLEGDQLISKKIMGTYSLKGKNIKLKLDRNFKGHQNLICEVEIDDKNSKNTYIDCSKHTKTVYHFVNGGISYECGG